MGNLISNMRDSSNKWFAKALLFILGLSFIFWGVSGKMMTGSNVALTVAGRQISVQEVDKELKRQVEQMRALMGGANFDARQAVRMGFLDQVVDNMVWRELLDAKARGMHLVPSDTQLYEMIKKYPEFQDGKGNFSPEKFSYLLQTNNIPEREFVAVVANELARASLAASLTEGMNPSLLASMLASYAAQERTLDIAAIRFDAERISARPSDDDLKVLFEQNADKFKEPEYRRISLIIVNEAAVKKARPRTGGDNVYRVMVEIAENIIDEKNGGSSNESLAKSFGVELKPLPPVDTNGNLRGGGKAPAILTPRLRDIAFFALDEGGISDLQEIGDSIVLVALDEIILAAPKPIESVRGELERFWLAQQKEASANEKALSLLNLISNGENFADSVLQVDRSMQFLPGFKWTAGSQALPSDVMERISKAEKGKPFSMRSKDGYYVIALRAVNFPKTEPSTEQKEETAKMFKGLVMSDYIMWLADRLGVDKNEAVLRRFGD